jgi:hypothetical protein
VDDDDDVPGRSDGGSATDLEAVVAVMATAIGSD